MGSVGEVTRGAVQVLTGVRRLEAQLLTALASVLDVPLDAPGALSRPVRVVVPSGSLRAHVAARIARQRGRAVVGLVVQTLDRVAFEILSQAGIALDDPLLFPVAVRREARREPALAEGLEDRVDGYGAVVAAVDDLLDAGFEPAHAEVLEEHLEAQVVGRDRAARARAVVRVAGRVASGLRREGIGHRSHALVLARDALLADPDRLPHRGIFLYGIADATGVQADLIAALVDGLGATLLLDAPRDPSAAVPRRAGTRFGAAFRDRFPEALVADAPGHASGRIGLLEAPTPSAEVRAVALRLRACIEAGAAPESLAVVARDLGPYRSALRVQLRRFGVPFSGANERGAATASRRRLDALIALLAPDEEPAMETWLVARDGLEVAARVDVRQQCHRRGALRVAEVAPLLAGSATARSATRLLEALDRRPAMAPLERHVAWLDALTRDALGWRQATIGADALRAVLATFPAGPSVDAHEFVSLLSRRLADAGWTKLGGEGGGVQVLSVMEARARSFDRLFLIGLHRGAFPRSIQEDPLLPDAIRARLREVLPDLPVKRDGFDEERFLFAQLLSAAEELTLCWSAISFEGRPQPRSPLLESLDRAEIAVAHEVAPPLHAPTPASVRLALPERALLTGLYASRASFERSLARALDEAGPAGHGGDRAAARLAVLNEIDPRDGRRTGLGPYFGFVGDIAGEGDPRAGPFYVTRLEAMARCPWQAFLTRVLRLSPVPDAAGDLPGADDARLLGNVVHRVLERVAHRPLGDADDLTREAVPMAWPDDATLDAWLEAGAEQEMADDAIGLPGYERVLARRARPHLERARASDWAAGAPAVVATEVEAQARVRDVAGREREIRFKADRVDRVGGHLVLTDYKTGKPIAAQKTAGKRIEALCRDVAAGKALQAVLYARGGGVGAEGRYLFLRDDVLDEARSLVVRDGPPFDEPFDASVRVLLEVWDRGSFLPRLRQADRDEETSACRYCEVRDACIRGDSGARRRLERWSEEGGGGGAAERAAVAVYRLGVDS